MPKKVEKAKIALLATPLEITKTQVKAKIKITAADQIAAFSEQERGTLKRLADVIVASGANVVLCQKGIADPVQFFLAKNGIYAVEDVPEKDMKYVARSLGANIVNKPEDLTAKDLGLANIVEEDNDIDITRISGCKNPKATTILLRGTSDYLLDELERAVVDGTRVIMMRLDYIRVPGRAWVDDPDHPFDTIEMRDSLFRMLPRGQAAIMDDIPRAFSFKSESLKREEEPRIPPRVIREALVNAVMHRSYQIHGPVEVIRYANRLEIRNPGHSLKPVERLGEPGSQTRNPTIASVLHETKYAENKGSGIRVMQQLMDHANLSPPSFDSDREHDQFTATFLMHHFLDKQDIAWLAHFKEANLSDDEARILIHARENGWVNNAICRYYTKLDTLEASGILRRLRNLGLLQQHPHSAMTYYTPTPNLLRPELSGTILPADQKIPAHEKKMTLTDFTPDMIDPLPTNLQALPTNLQALPTNLQALPANLLEEIKGLGQRSPPGNVQKIIAELCAVRAFTVDELAAILNRNKGWIFRSYISPMIRDGILEYTEPDNPHHPNQAYRAKK